MQPRAATEPEPRVPRNRSAWIDASLVFAASFIYLRLLPDCFSLFDEGIYAHTVERLCAGELLYRDVFSYWTPGGFWLGAGMFHLGGNSVQGLRIMLAFFGAATAVAIWRLARDFGDRILALLAGVAAPLVCYPIWWMASSHWFSTFAALAAALGLRAAIRPHAPSRVVLGTGLLCGFTFVVLQPVGVFVTAAMAIALWWDRLWTTTSREATRSAALLAVGALLPPLVMYSYFALHGALGVMTYDTFTWTLEHFRTAFRAPYASLTLGLPKDASLQPTRWVLAAAPPTLYALGLLLPAIYYLRGSVSRLDQQLFAVAATGAGLLAGNYYYPDLVHLAFAAPPAFAAGIALWQRFPGLAAPKREPAAAMLLALLVAYAGTSAIFRARSNCVRQVVTRRGTVAVAADDAQDLVEVLAFVSTQFSPGEPFFVYPYAPGYYYLSGHPNPTRYEYLFPYLPHANTDAQLAEVVSALDGQGVRYVLLSPLWGQAMLARYDTVVERYIREHFHIAHHFPKTVLLERDAAERPGEKILRIP